MRTKQERKRLDRIFKVQLTEDQASALEEVGARESLSAAAVIRRAVIRDLRLSPETPNRSEETQKGTDEGERQRRGVKKAVA